MKKLLLMFFTSFASLPNLHAAEAGVLGEAKFDAVGNPGFLSIAGEKGKVTGKYVKAADKITGTFDVDLNTLETGMDLRDKHMKEKYLEVGKYPKASLTVTGVPIAKDGAFKFAGKLTLHGQTKPIDGDCLVKDVINFECKFKISLPDYGIAIPDWKGVTVAKDVSLVIAIVIK